MCRYRESFDVICADYACTRAHNNNNNDNNNSGRRRGPDDGGGATEIFHGNTRPGSAAPGLIIKGSGIGGHYWASPVR